MCPEAGAGSDVSRGPRHRVQMTARKSAKPRTPRGVAALLPEEWQGVYRGVPQTLKMLDLMQSYEDAHVKNQRLQGHRDMGRILSELDNVSAELWECEKGTVEHRKYTALRARLQKEKVKVQAQIIKIQAKAARAWQKVLKLQEAGLVIDSIFQDAPRRSKGGQSRAVTKGQAGSRKRAHPSLSPFVDLLLFNNDVFGIVLSFLAGPLQLGACSRDTRAQVLHCLTGLSCRVLVSKAIRPLGLCTRMPNLTSLTLSSGSYDASQMLNSTLPARLEALTLPKWSRALYGVQWPRLHTLDAHVLEMDLFTLRRRNSLPALSTLRMHNYFLALGKVAQALQEGLLPCLSRVACTGDGGGPPCVHETCLREDVATLVRVLRLAPATGTLWFSVGEAAMPVLGDAIAAKSAFQNLKRLHLLSLYGQDMGTSLLPALAAHTPLLECLYLFDGRLPTLTLPTSCWPHMHTLRLTVNGCCTLTGTDTDASSLPIMALLAAAGPGLRVLDLCMVKMADEDTDVSVTLAELVTLLEALHKCQGVTWRSSLRHLLLPLLSDERPDTNRPLTGLPQSLGHALLSTLRSLPALLSLTTPPLGSPLIIALIAAKADGGLPLLHSLKFHDWEECPRAILLMIAWMLKEDTKGVRDDSKAIFKVYGMDALYHSSTSPMLTKRVKQLGLEKRFLDVE